MPELPEVETIRQELLKKIKNKKISAVLVNLSKQVFVDGKKGDVKNFIRILKGAEIKNIGRRAKILKIELNNDFRLYIHLKMTGQLIYRNSTGEVSSRGGHPWPLPDVEVPNKWTHVIFTFSDGSHLYFNDLRQFGYIKLVGGATADRDNFGPEPLEKSFTLDVFKKILPKWPKRKIKQLLMDQSIIAGIGNIYSDEILFYSGVLPARAVFRLKEKEIKKIYQGIKLILKNAIKARGTSVDMYRDAAGRKGGFEKYLKVYNRKGKKCKKCGIIIIKIKIGGRSAHYCPKCQK